MNIVLPAKAAVPTRGLSGSGRFFKDQTFHFETLRNAGYAYAQCADLGDVLETTKQIVEGDLESWYNAWAATGARVEALAERTQDKTSKGDAYMRASTYQKSLVNARSVTTRVFDRSSGGGEHCRCGNTSLLHAAVFDWLLEKFR